MWAYEELEQCTFTQAPFFRQLRTLHKVEAMKTAAVFALAAGLSTSLFGCGSSCPYDPCDAASTVQGALDMVGKTPCELYQINIDCTKAGGACEGADQSVADAAVAVYEAAKPSDC